MSEASRGNDGSCAALRAARDTAGLPLGHVTRELDNVRRARAAWPAPKLYAARAGVVRALPEAAALLEYARGCAHGDS